MKKSSCILELELFLMAFKKVFEKILFITWYTLDHVLQERDKTLKKNVLNVKKILILLNHHKVKKNANFVQVMLSASEKIKLLQSQEVIDQVWHLNLPLIV